MLTIDFETTNFSKGNALDKRNSLLLIAWRGSDGITHITDDPLDSEFWKAYDKAESVCAYNCKFEMLWLKRMGADIDKKNWFDPMLAEKVLLGNVSKPMSLDAVCQRYGLDAKDPVIDSLMKAGVCPSDMPQERLRGRCKQDVRTTYQLHKIQQKQIEKRDQIHLYRNRCDFAAVLAHIEAEGMLLDKKRVDYEYTLYAVQAAAYDGKLKEITGGINMNSPDQKAHFLYGKMGFPERKRPGGKPLRNKPSKQFPNGRPKTDADTLTWLATQATTDEQREFIEIAQLRSKAHAAVSKNLEFFKGVCLEHGCHFHGQFNQTVAATHRLTSSGRPLAFEYLDGKEKSVQFQNMPREFKKVFKAPEDYKVIEVDASQLEFRVAAFVADDPQARKDIADPDFDAHVFSASQINDIDYDALLSKFRAGDKHAKMLRQAAKEHTFKPLYGGRRGTPGEEKYYREFAARYKHLTAVQENWLGEVMREGSLITPWRMKFSWETYTKPNGMVMNKATHKPVAPQVCNYPVQNLATAEIVPIAICSLYRRCKEQGLDVRFVNTIHDSVICYVYDDERTMERFRAAAELAFTTDVYEHLKLFYGIEFDVPLGMEMVTGDHWNEGTEHVYDDVNNWREAA
jgi:DNA polymerase I-like protein with 3'-5' exonuclease and polymerase domains